MSVKPLDALLSAAEQRLLAALLGHPDRDYGTLELLALAGSSRSAGSTLINRWIQAGLLRECRIGNQRRIAADPTFVLYPELRRIVMKTVGVKEPLMEALIPLNDKISEAFVFGSVASGTDTSSSDIDLAIVGDVTVFDLSQVLDELQQALGRAVHANIYSAAEWASKRDPVLAAIKNGPRINIIEGTVDTTT